MSFRGLVAPLAKWSVPVLTLAALGTTASLAEGPVVLPGADAPAIAGDGRRADTLLYYSVRFYDMQERAGLCVSSLACTPTGGYTNSFCEDWRISDGKYTSVSGTTGSFRFVADPPGTEYLWRVTVPGLPPVAGYVGTDLGFYYTAYPIQGYDLGMDVARYTHGHNAFGFNATPFFADSCTSSSPVLPWSNMPQVTSRRMVYTAEYLPGNALYELGRDVHEVPPGTRPETLSIGWGPAWTPQPIGTYNIRFRNEIPSGPLRLSVWIDGYTTDSILVENATNGDGIDWDCMFTKSATTNAGLTPGEIAWKNLPWPPSFASRLKALQWSLSGQTTELSNLKRHLDLSGDGVQDVADLLMANAGALARSAPHTE